MKQHSLQAHSHHGGTLVGFVVGLLVGLGIALAVAVYVTRVPVPFVDRTVSRKPAQDLEEAERNKGWNPNAQLAGNPVPTTPVGTDTGAISVPPADDQPLPSPPAASAAAGKPSASPAADPLGDLVASRLGQGTPTSATSAPPKGTPTAVGGAEPFTYFVQVGAFKSPEDAQAQRARLAMMGMTAEVTEREQSGRTVYRVRIGPFAQKGVADATREQLEAQGVEAALVRIQR